MLTDDELLRDDLVALFEKIAALTSDEREAQRMMRRPERSNREWIERMRGSANEIRRRHGVPEHPPIVWKDA